jgi:eukaryotic-like serine/threonine-protein kinase
MLGFRGTTRFRLIRFLGRGGMGVVYEAFDEVNAAPVALKLLPVVSPDLLFRFKREFRLAADIRHQNLVRLGELVSEGSQWFFTMELVQGIDLLSYARGADQEGQAAAPFDPLFVTDGPGATLPSARPVPPQPVAAGNYNEERVRSTLGQLAQGLIALHAAGCVHRDVKPSNVLVTREGRAVLLDFGLTSASTGESTLVGAGTPEYMAPEQAAQESVTAAADWYALGTILFELLTGRLPFQGLRHEILFRKHREAPPHVGAIAGGAPHDLARLCDALLDRNPANRLSGPDVLACLAPSRATVLGTPAQEALLPVVGREEELRDLALALTSVTSGAGGQALIIRGESGVGKSTLARSFLASSEATDQDIIVLTARCYERELLPFKAVDGLIDALTNFLRKRGSAFLEQSLPRHAWILLQAFPVLGRIEQIARTPQEMGGLEPREVRSSMFSALRELLKTVAKEKPIVAYIDDLQWADGDSLALLAEVLRPPDAPRILLLGTLRTRGSEDQERLFATDVPERQLRLRNLPSDAARALARDILRSRGETSADGTADLLARESDGHPLFLLQLARGMHSRPREGASLTLDSVLRAQIEGFSPSAIRLLRALALASAPTPLRTLRRVVALEGVPFVNLLDELRAKKLVHSASDRGDEVVDIAHDRIRQAARASTSTSEAKDLHERLAEAFEDSGDTLRAAGHWRESGHRDRAATHFASAAKRASGALAFDRAVEHYQAALELGTWVEDKRRELLVGLADALSNAGRGAAAAPHYLEAARNAGAANSLDLRRRGAEEFLRSGQLDEGRKVAADALAAAGLGFARSPVRALLFQRAVLRARGRQFRRREAEQIAPQDLARIDLCWSLSSGLGLTDPVQGAHFQVRSLLLALRAGEPYRVARGIAGEAAYAAAQGQAKRSHRLLVEAGRIADGLTHPHATGIVSLTSGLASHLLGEFAQGLAHLETARRIFRERCVGTAWELNAARHFTLECLYYLGALARFRTSVADGLKEASDRGSVYATTTLRTGLANAIWLLDDDPTGARAEVLEAMRAWSSRGYHIQHWYQLIAETQIDLYNGDCERAYVQYERGWRVLRQSHLPKMSHTRIVATHLRARAAIAAASMATTLAARTERLRVAEWSGARLGREDKPWSHAFAALVKAGVEQVKGNDRGAKRWFERGIAETGELGLSLFKAAAQIAGAELTGDVAAGRAAESWMRQNGVKAPRVMARMLVPGAPASAGPGTGMG